MNREDLIDEMTPEELKTLTVGGARRCQLQREFHVYGRKFVQAEGSCPGDTYFVSGAIRVHHDQQDSSTWFATINGGVFGYYWTPQDAAGALLDTINAAKDA